MKVCYAHVKDDSTPQCPRRAASQPESPRGDGRQIVVGLPVGGDQRDCGTAYAGGVARTSASKETGCRRVRHRPPGTRRTRGAVIVLDASAAVDWLVQTAAAQRIESRIFSRNQSLHAPELLDLEVAQVLRRLVRE